MTTVGEGAIYLIPLMLYQDIRETGPQFYKMRVLVLDVQQTSTLPCGHAVLFLKSPHRQFMALISAAEVA